MVETIRFVNAEKTSIGGVSALVLTVLRLDMKHGRCLSLTLRSTSLRIVYTNLYKRTNMHKTQLVVMLPKLSRAKDVSWRYDLTIKYEVSRLAPRDISNLAAPKAAPTIITPRHLQPHTPGGRRLQGR
jgi:hypothetical protein